MLATAETEIVIAINRTHFKLFLIGCKMVSLHHIFPFIVLRSAAMQRIKVKI